MSKWMEIVKELLGKRMIPAILALAGSLTTILFLPKDYWVITKLGMNATILLAFCVYFLIITFLVFLCKKIPTIFRHIKEQKELKQQEHEDEKQRDEKFMDFFDNLDQSTINLIKRFLANNNTPLEVPFQEFSFRDDFTCGIPQMNGQNFKNNIFIAQMISMDDSEWAYRVVMQADTYALARHINQKYGKITRFEF